METKEFVVTVRRRQFDEIAYRMISENEIYGIIDFSVEEQANDVLVSYQNEAYVPLPVYFERELTRAEILRIFENYFAIMDGMAGFLLDEHQLLLDCRQVYIDPESGELRLIYLPDLACEEEISIAEFIRQILFLVRYDPNEDSSYIVRIMNELNARTEFDSERFCALIHELATEDVPAKQELAVPEGAYLLRESTKEKIYLPDEGLVMGKDPQQSDYCIAENQAVSRRHAQLEKLDGEWNLIDLNSLNGTYKNGERLVGNIANRLKNKDVIFLADERFIYYA